MGEHDKLRATDTSYRELSMSRTLSPQYGFPGSPLGHLSDFTSATLSQLVSYTAVTLVTL